MKRKMQKRKSKAQKRIQRTDDKKRRLAEKATKKAKRLARKAIREAKRAEKENQVEEIKEARGVLGKDKRSTNYFSIHGTTAGGLVAAKSNLAIEVLQ